MSSRRRASGGELDRLGRAVVDSAARAQQLRVVVAPARAREREHPLALAEGRLGVRVRVDEDVAVVEGRHQLDRARQQHPVAEDVARHVADPGDRDRLRLHVDPEVAEVVPHALPRPAGGDAHLLVVVARAAARGERVAEPEAVLRRHAVGGVGEVRGALVGRHHQVRVVAVEAHDLGRVQHLAVRAVVRHVEQAGHELPVAVDQVLVERRPRRNVALQHEAALRADRHDHRVLDHLGLHQPQDLGAEVVVAVRPADAAARHLAAAQVDALEPPRVDVDLVERPRRGHGLDRAAVDLDREHRPLRPLEGVRAQHGPHQVGERPQHLVLGQAAHRVERVREGGVGRGHERAAIAGRDRVEARREGLVEGARGLAVAHQHAVQGVGVPVRAHLQQVVAQRAQQLHVAPAEARRQDQPVERVVGGPLLVERPQHLDEALLAPRPAPRCARRGLRSRSGRAGSAGPPAA